LDAGHKKQQHKTELVGWFVGCFSNFYANHTLRNYATWFGQLTISHIKQQVVHPCNHTNEARFESQNENTKPRAVFCGRSISSRVSSLQAGKKRRGVISGNVGGDFNNKKRDPLYPLKWWCLEIWISNRHLLRSMKSSSSCNCPAIANRTVRLSSKGPR
jgi:hypothetical protein